MSAITTSSLIEMDKLEKSIALPIIFSAIFIIVVAKVVVVLGEKAGAKAGAILVVVVAILLVVVVAILGVVVGEKVGVNAIAKVGVKAVAKIGISDPYIINTVTGMTLGVIILLIIDFFLYKKSKLKTNEIAIILGTGITTTFISKYLDLNGIVDLIIPSVLAIVVGLLLYKKNYIVFFGGSIITLGLLYLKETGVAKDSAYVISALIAVVGVGATILQKSQDDKKQRIADKITKSRIEWLQTFRKYVNAYIFFVEKEKDIYRIFSSRNESKECRIKIENHLNPIAKKDLEIINLMDKIDENKKDNLDKLKRYFKVYFKVEWNRIKQEADSGEKEFTDIDFLEKWEEIEEEYFIGECAVKIKEIKEEYVLKLIKENSDSTIAEVLKNLIELLKQLEGYSTIGELIEKLKTNTECIESLLSDEISCEKSQIKEDIEKLETKEDIEKLETKEDIEKLETKEDIEKLIQKIIKRHIKKLNIINQK